MDEAEAPKTGMKYFEKEFIALQGIKRALIEKALAGGISRSSSLQMVVTRMDAHVENALLYIQHADGSMQFFDAMGEKAAADAASPEGSAIKFPVKE